eukprot:CAMPEP_0172498256 /NCGR_PEP_ID=MMETSP1066-20121228/111308_1 /TAXON_ID=671091 /ORGANISM="Coscinodiscus wailesii, Strain CCMP2513" /LENGTH=125 /DNA_ID=CAMNT_0013271471 /DNA_START=293 /DNA_END=670 /DNA_ORIENTATION=-
MKTNPPLPFPNNGNDDNTPKVTPIESKEQWKTTLSHERPVICKFTAEWCQPCKKINPFYSSLSARHYPSVNFVTVDVDDWDEIAAECRVSMMPTFCLFRDGVLVESVSGANEGRLEELVKKSLEL